MNGERPCPRGGGANILDEPALANRRRQRRRIARHVIEPRARTVGHVERIPTGGRAVEVQLQLGALRESIAGQIRAINRYTRYFDAVAIIRGLKLSLQTFGAGIIPASANR